MLLILAITIHNIPGEALPATGQALPPAQLPGWEGAGQPGCGSSLEGCADVSCLYFWGPFFSMGPCGMKLPVPVTSNSVTPFPLSHLLSSCI